MLFQEQEYVNKFQVISYKGAGAFGETYKVLHTGLEQIWALKFSKKMNCVDEIQKVLTEAQVQVQFENDNIVKVYDVDKYESDRNLYIYIAMEYMSNGTLGSFMKTHFISVKNSIDLFIKILFALEYMHGQGYLHRDIKPDNILLDENYNPKLSDFGLSNTIEECLKSGQGYTSHIAPECFSDFKNTIQTDIYAAGVTLYRIINNFANWDEVLCCNKITCSDLAKGNLIKKIGFNPWISKKVIRIINKATNKDPNKRYKSITEFKNALSKLNIIYDWTPAKNGLEWNGVGAKYTYKIEITNRPRLKKWGVVVKKNNRKFKNLLCNSEQEAFDKMFEFIRGTYNEQ